MRLRYRNVVACIARMSIGLKSLLVGNDMLTQPAVAFNLGLLMGVGAVGGIHRSDGGQSAMI